MLASVLRTPSWSQASCGSGLLHLPEEWREREAREAWEAMVPQPKSHGPVPSTFIRGRWDSSDSAHLWGESATFLPLPGFSVFPLS